MSLIAEGSYDKKGLRKNIRRATEFIFILLGASIIAIFLGGKYLLLIFGEKYMVNSFDLLLILVAGSVPFAINSIYTAVKRVKKETNSVVLVYFCISMVTILGSYFLIPRAGLIGVGYAWVSGNLLVNLFIFAKLFFEGLHLKTVQTM